tara:strand:+ start:273 stop:608 length:336 start_codon:yes stop_codon:yes gene_type:complete
VTLRTTHGKFKFICNACHKHIKDGDGVVDFPIPGLSENKDYPHRHYHRGDCAAVGESQMLDEGWYSQGLSAYIIELIRNHTVRESGSGKPCNFYNSIISELSKDYRSPLKH